MRKTNLIIIFLVILSFATAIYIYPSMPERMASHWNAAGEVNGYTSRFWGVMLMPLISLASLFLFLLIPKIDPLKDNIAKFRSYFDWFIILFLAFLYYLYVLTLAWSKNYRFDMTRALLPAFAVLFYYVGVLVSKAEPNWTIGIRTPWTLSSEQVWRKTHALGAKIYKVSAIISLAGIFSPKYGLWFLLFPVIGGSLFMVIYSYHEFQKEKKSENLSR